MAAADNDAAVTTPISTLLRRKSVESPATLILNTKQHNPSSSSYTTTTTSSSASSSSSSADYELVSLKPPSYTSLRDIIPTAVIQSPKPPSFAAQSGYEISIRNRLVKQAAWAYLQPMSTTPGASGSTVFHRLWNRFSDAFIRLFTHICDCFIRSTQLRTTSSRL
ncbi:hypothetical protein R6Q59_007654 [Mikania micrantha]